MTISAIVETCAGIFLIAVVIEAAVTKQVRRFVLQAGLLGFVLVLGLSINVAVNGIFAFGEDSFPVAGIVSISVAAPLGIASRSLFDLQPDRFSWLGFVKPLTITPIVLLPLVGSLQGAAQLRGIQIVSLALLAFQNGFFWQAVLQSAKPAVSTARRQSRREKQGVA
jgi:hypothetical protein